MANDLIVQTTIDRRVMAVLLDLFETQGADIRSISELARLSLEALASIAVTKFGIQERTSTPESTARLQEITYGTALLNNRRYGAGLLKNLQEQQIEDRVNLPRPRGRTPQWSQADTNRLIDAANKAVENPTIKKLFEELRNGKGE